MNSSLLPISPKYGYGLWNGRAPDSGHYGRYCLHFVWPRHPLSWPCSPAAESCREWPRRIGPGRWTWKEPRQPKCGTLGGENQATRQNRQNETTNFRTQSISSVSWEANPPSFISITSGRFSYSEKIKDLKSLTSLDEIFPLKKWTTVYPLVPTE